MILDKMEPANADLTPTARFDIALLKAGFASMRDACDKTGFKYTTMRDFRADPVRATVKTAMLCCMMVRCGLEDVYGSEYQDFFTGGDDE